MSEVKGTPASDKTREAIALAKKHRISVDDAKAILDAHGDNAKAADKAARRIAA